MFKFSRIFRSYIARGSKSTELELLNALRAADSPVEQTRLIFELGKLNHANREYTFALDFYDRGLSTLKPLPSSKETAFLTSCLYHGQAAVHAEQQDFEKALVGAEKSLGIRKSLFGSNHPAVAESLTTIGTALLRQNRVTRACECFEQALTGFLEFTKGKEDNVYVTIAFFNLGTAYMRNAEMADHGLAAVKKSLQLAEIVFGVGHPQTEAIRAALREVQGKNKIVE